VARWLANRWRNLPAVRVALHPLDFDEADMVASITNVLEILGRNHVCASYDLINGVVLA
jgi:hypothetical protein